MHLCLAPFSLVYGLDSVICKHLRLFVHHIALDFACLVIQLPNYEIRHINYCLGLLDVKYQIVSCAFYIFNV